MKISKDIKPISYLKNHTAEVVNQINRTHRPMVITQNGHPKAVLQDAESFEKTQTVLIMLKLLTQSEEDIKHSRVLDQEQVFAEIEKQLNNDEN
jgi:prevent-host-death family protein